MIKLLLLCIVWLTATLCCSGQRYLGLSKFQIQNLVEKEFEGNGESVEGKAPYIYAYKGLYSIACYFKYNRCFMYASSIKGADLMSLKKSLVISDYKYLSNNKYIKNNVIAEIVYNENAGEFVTYVYYK